MQTVSVLIAEEDLKYLDRVAKEKGLSRSSLARMIIRQWIRGARNSKEEK